MNGLESPETMSYNEIIAKGQLNLFNFSYPIFNEAYRTTLQTNICKHYYTSEICCDAVERFRLWLDVRLNTIMPYYNHLYKIEWDKLNPLTDYLEDETYASNREQSGNGSVTQEDSSNSTNDTTTNSEGSSTGLTKESSTPQGMLSNLEYYDNASDNTQNASSTETANNTATVSYNSNRDNTYGETNKENTARHREGYKQNLGDLLVKFSQSKEVINIDRQIIDELSDLFFGILSVG